jgi:hypothetical protein
MRIPISAEITPLNRKLKVWKTQRKEWRLTHVLSLLTTVILNTQWVYVTNLFRTIIHGPKKQWHSPKKADCYLPVTQQFAKYFDVCHYAFDFKMSQNTSTLAALCRFQKIVLKLLSCFAALPRPYWGRGGVVVKVLRYKSEGRWFEA